MGTCPLLTAFLCRKFSADHFSRSGRQSDQTKYFMSCLSSFFHLLFQSLINFSGDRHFKGPFQAFALYCLLKALHSTGTGKRLGHFYVRWHPTRSHPPAVLITRIISFLLFISPQPMHCLSGIFFTLTYDHSSSSRVLFLLFVVIFLVVILSWSSDLPALISASIPREHPEHHRTVQSHLLKQAHLLCLCLALDIDLKSGQSCCQSVRSVPLYRLPGITDNQER